MKELKNKRCDQCHRLTNEGLVHYRRIGKPKIYCRDCIGMFDLDVKKYLQHKGLYDIDIKNKP